MPPSGPTPDHFEVVRGSDRGGQGGRLGVMWLIWYDEDAAEAWLRPELRPETKRRVGPDEPVPAFPLVSVAEDRGFEPLRAINPTRFPSERHRPLGESSAGEGTGRTSCRRNQPDLGPRDPLT